MDDKRPAQSHQERNANRARETDQLADIDAGAIHRLCQQKLIELA
jgi:hypothetical protein